MDQIIVRIRHPGCHRSRGDVAEAKGLAGCPAVPIDGHDDEGGWRRGVGVLIRRNGNPRGRHGGGTHAVKTGPDELTVIAYHHQFFGAPGGTDQGGVIGAVDPPMEEGVHVSGGHALVDPIGLLQTGRHGSVETRAAHVGHLGFPIFLVGQVAPARRVDVVGPPTVDMPCDDAHQRSRDRVVHGGGG